MELNEIISIFKQRNFRATPQRIAVYKYLKEHYTHPDAEEIYNALLADNPSFSKTTVYNSLQALAQEGLIIPVNIDSQRVHYDGNPNTHGHFVCNKCNKIFDFETKQILCKGIEDFTTTQQDVYFRGLCPQCK